MSRAPTIDDYLRTPAHHLRQMGGQRLKLKPGPDSDQPLVTVITIVKNGKETLRQTIMSVLSQSYPNIEYVVVDGASTDGTLEIIKQFDDKIDLWISEPDCGTSDAFNKAVSLSQGDYIFWLASDDWINPDYVEKAILTLLESGADFVFGDMVMYKHGDPAVLYKGDKNYAKSLMSGYPRFNFPTMMVKRKCYINAGLMDLTYKYVSDYEWIMRLHLNGECGSYDSALVVHRRVGGIGESQPVQSALEHLRLLRKYRLPKTKAMIAYLSFMVRRIAGNIAKLFLPKIIYKKLKWAVRRNCLAPLN